MATPVRYDEQYCPIARAMDVLGDRWTLLILRELMLGEQRFSDLRTNLPGIAATVLTARLHLLVEEGLVETVALGPSTRRSAYALTRRGRDAVPVLGALARFGFPLLEAPSPDTDVRPELAVRAAVAAKKEPAAAKGVDERYELVVDGTPVVLSSVRGGGAPKAPRLRLESTAEVWIHIRQGETTVDEAIAAGALRVTGPAGALRNLRAVFRLDRPA